MTKSIKFIPMSGISYYPPKPAIKDLPDWWLKTQSYVGGKPKKSSNGDGFPTIKKCVPVFDAITAGYILYTQVDIYIEFDGQEKFFHYPQSDDWIKPLSIHAFEQAGKYEDIHRNSGNPIPKLEQPFGIKTPPGYSCLFINPLHRKNKIFTILEGIVDTDRLHSPVNFPFTFNDDSWSGLIPAGTPIAQVIPFKRDSWTMKIDESAKTKENIEKDVGKLRSVFWNGYKSMFWNKKSFK